MNLASVNAGNSDGLCVGLGGVNGGFLQALTSAKQTRANLSPNQLCKPGQGNYDDYQDRHVKLLAQAGSSGSASASYANTGPLRVLLRQLDPWRRPSTPTMPRRSIFCKAIEATARNIIQAVAGYNAIAAQQNRRSRRNTLYSSNIYNLTLQVPHADIAGAILAGQG